MATDCVAVRVRILNRVISGIYDDALRPLGLGAGQLNVLIVVGRLENPRVSEIAEVLRMDQSTVSRNIKPLLRDGLLSSSSDEADARAQRISLTRRGVAKIDQAYPAWKAAQTNARKLVGDSLDDVISRLTPADPS